MASDLQIQGEVVVNSEQAEGAFNRVGDKAQQMANEVATSAGKAGQAVDKIGDGAGASAEKFTRAESRISASIKRATNELELLGKTASQRLEFNISDKGLDAAKFEPALKKLREIEAQALQTQRAATGSLDGMGMSAKATAAALRGIPAQFQDIVVSLQGGQAPLTVFLQQGSQLSGMFGGAGAAARAFGGYVLGLVNPFTVAAGAAAALAIAYNQGSKEADGYAKSIALTGNAAGTTGVQLQQMAARISASVGTQGAAADALAQLAGTGKVASQNLEQFAETAVRVERTMGVAIKDTVKEFAELGKAPVEASKKLNETYGYLTAAVFEQIKALEGQGRALEAASVAQQAYDRAMSNVATTLQGQLGSLERGWIAVAGAAKKGWDAMLNVGRPDTLATQLEAARANLAAAESAPSRRDSMTGERGRQARIENLRNEISLLSEQERVLKRGAEAQALRTQAEKDGIAAAEALQKTQDKGLSKQEQMNKALADYRKQLADLRATNPNSDRLTPAAVARGESAIRDQFADKGALASINKEQSAYASLIAIINAKIAANDLEVQFSGRVTEADKLRIKLMEELTAGARTLTAAHKASALAQLERLEAQEREKLATKSNVAAYQEQVQIQEELAQAYVAQNKAVEAGRAGVLAYANGIDETSKALQYELSLMGQGERARNAALEQYRIELELKKQLAEITNNSAFTEAEREEERAKARAAAAIATANASSRAFLDEWKQSVSKYDDIFRQGFADMLNNGKDGWKSFTKSLATTFKTTVADQLYKAFAQPFVVNIVGNLLGLTGGSGLAGVASAAAGGGSALGGIGNLASLGSNLFGGGLGSTISGAIGSGVGALFGTTAGNAALGTSLGLGAGSATAAATAAAQAGGAAAGAASAAATTGASIATAIPYFGAAIAALTLLAGSFKGETRYGGGFEVREGKALRTTGDVSSTLPEGAIVSSVQGTFDTINALYEKYGSQFLVTNIQAGIETSGKGRGGTFAGGLVSGGGATDIKFGDFFTDRVGASLNAEEAIKAFAGDLNKAVISALQTATDLPKFVQRQLEGIDPKSLGADKAAELLKTIGDLPNVLLQGFGTTRDALVQQFAQGLATGDATAAGQSVADTLVASIEASLYTDAAGKIFDIVNNGIVAPMLDAIATGASVSEALSQATIDKTIERAKSQASALAELFGNAEFTAALESIRTTVGDALGQAGGSFGYTPKFQIEAAQQIDVAAQSASTAADEAARAAEEAARAWQDITDALLGDRSSAEIDLLRAQGKEEEALAAERARAIVGYDAYQVSLYDGTQAIFSQIEAIDKATEAREREAESVANLFSALDSSASRFLSGDALSGFQSTRQSDQLRGLGFDVSASQILGATTDQVKAFTLAVLGMDSVSNDAKTALLQLAGSILDTKESAQQAAQQNALQGVDTAFATLQRSVSLQRGVLSETATELKSVFDLLKTNVRDLYGEVDGAAQAQAAKARDFITKALGAARTTGYLPDSQELQDAIGSARSGLDATVYASQAEAEFQRLVLANELRDLQDISGDQLTEAEKQIKALDDILENAQTQVDALRSIDQSVLTVAGAIAALGVSISAAIGAGVKPGAGGTITAPSSGTKYGNSAVMDAAGYVQSAAAQGDLMGIYQGAKANGLNSADTAYLLQLSGFDVSKDDVLAWVKSQGLPSFAVGTNYVPKDMLAQIHKGEAIVPAAYNPAANPGMGASTARMENLLAEINAKLEELKGLQDEGNGHTGAMRDLIDRVSAGGNSLAVDVMNQPTVEVAA